MKKPEETGGNRYNPSGINVPMKKCIKREKKSSQKNGWTEERTNSMNYRVAHKQYYKNKP